MSSIRVSEKYGVNPSMDTCFYCGEVTGVALMGKISTKDNHDVEAPRYVCSSVTPCDKCKEKYKDYVLMVEAKSSDPKNPQPRYQDFTVPIEKRIAPRKGGVTSMGFAAEGMAPGQRFPGDTQGETQRRGKK